MSGGLLEIAGLTLSLPVDGESRRILRGVDLSIDPGECVGLVGESGSGKSMTARSVIRMLPGGSEIGGSVRLGGDEVLAMSDRELQAVRGSRVAMIFQDPRAHIDPIRTIGDHMTEAMCLVADRSRKEARREAATLLEAVRLDDPDELMGRYPHELSGGMLQRVMIAGALACGPDLLLADEPTTALDVTTQAEVVAILSDLQVERSLGVLFITHDLELATAICDRIAVMYAGEVVEESPAETLHTAPLHPYTSGLLDSRPTLDDDPSLLSVIPGHPIAAFEVDEGCPFAPRCRLVDEICRREAPPERRLGVGRVRCHHDLATPTTPEQVAS
ncbi:MAG: ABC transporter ATP-binding protein [Solirubrobacterales bacterium]